MPTVSERVSVLETKVVNIDGKIDDLKSDLREVQVCIDRTGSSIHKSLSEMSERSAEAHNELSKKISDLEKFKAKWTYLIIGGIAAFSWAAGHLSALNSFLK